jgi:hypothetical protein
MDDPETALSLNGLQLFRATETNKKHATNGTQRGQFCGRLPVGVIFRVNIERRIGIASDWPANKDG